MLATYSRDTYLMPTCHRNRGPPSLKQALDEAALEWLQGHEGAGERYDTECSVCSKVLSILALTADSRGKYKDKTPHSICESYDMKRVF